MKVTLQIDPLYWAARVFIDAVDRAEAQAKSGETVETAIPATTEMNAALARLLAEAHAVRENFPTAVLQ